VSLKERQSGHQMEVKLIGSPSEASRAARSLSSATNSLIPVMVTSAVSGDGLDTLKTFLFSLKRRIPSDVAMASDSVEFGIDDIYTVQGIGVVVNGIVRSGTVRVGDSLAVGPSKDGRFRSVTVQSIHCRRNAVSFAFCGQMASVALLEVDRKEDLRRGMVLVAGHCARRQLAVYSFEAAIDELSACTLREDSQPMVHIENIRQSAHILHLHRGHAVSAVLTFLHRPEFIRCGMDVIIRKSHGPIAVGRVTKLLDSAEAPLVPLGALQKPQRFRTKKQDTDGFADYLRQREALRPPQRRGDQQPDDEKERDELFSTTDTDDAEEHSTRQAVDSGTAAPNDQPLADGHRGHAVDRKHDEHSIRRGGAAAKRRRATGGARKRKKKATYSLVWRSGLGFEHFYPNW